MISGKRQCSLCNGSGMLRLKPSIEKELSDLRESVRRLVGDLDTFIAAKGRHNTAVAYERLVASRTAFLAENKEITE